MDVSEIKEICKKEIPDTRWKRRFSYYITWALLKLNFTANQVSAFGLLLGMTSCIFFAMGDKIIFSIGGIMLFFGQMMDYCDGEVARYRTSKKLPDELLRKHGGGFDCLNHIAPFFALVCMSIGLMKSTNYPILILATGFFAGTCQFIRSGLKSSLIFILKVIGKKYASKQPFFFAPSIMYMSLFLSFISLFDRIVDKNFTWIVFIIVTFLIFIEVSTKLMKVSD